MRTHIEFRSDAFPAEPGEEEKINPGRWRAALVPYLIQELTLQDTIADALESVLRKHPGVRELRWWRDSKRRD